MPAFSESINSGLSVKGEGPLRTFGLDNGINPLKGSPHNGTLGEPSQGAGCEKELGIASRNKHSIKRVWTGTC